MSRDLATHLACALERWRHGLGRLGRYAEGPIARNALLCVFGVLCVATDIARHTGIPTILAIVLLYRNSKQRTAPSSRPPCTSASRS